MGEFFLNSVSMHSQYPSTLLSMDPTNSCDTVMVATHENSVRELIIQRRLQVSLSFPAPDINLPLSVDNSTPPTSWSSDSCEILDLSPYKADVDATVLHPPKVSSRKCTKRGDSIWGGWFFFNYYFKPLLSLKSKAKITHNENGFAGFDKSDLKLDVFLVQHDMENMYMWIFKEKPENALGKMQLRSYMNGHSRLAESQFPFSADKGFLRSHRMQRKHYKGLSNPQCIHGIEYMSLPNLSCVSDGDRKKWKELTGRDLKTPIPPEASDFGTWRNLPGVEFELERSLPALKSHLHGSTRGLLNHDGDVLDPSSSHCNKRRKHSPPRAIGEHCCLPVNSYPDRTTHDMEIHPVEPSWIHDFSGVMRQGGGPVTAAKTIYEDDKGYLIMVSMPLCEQHRVKVCWRNDLSHGIVKIYSMSTARLSSVRRHDRTFRLTDPSPEHCPPGEFVREISLATRIHEDAKIEAYYDETGTILEIMVPKHSSNAEEHEVHVSMCPPHSPSWK